MINRDYSLLGSESKTVIDQGLVNAKWYQSPVPATVMKELLVRSNQPGIRDTLIWIVLIIGSGILVFINWGHWYAVFPYLVYSVLYASTSDSRWHESSHGTVFKTPWMNNLLYEIASFMVVRQSTAWKWSHARHHSDTIVRGRDPEISVKSPPDFKGLILTFFGISAAIPEYKKMLGNAFGKIDPEVENYLPESERPKLIRTARIYMLIYILVMGISIGFQTWLPLMYIGLPTFLGSWLMPFYGFTQHAGLQENVLDHRLNSRTVYMNRIHRFLYWNMNYHIEHHMFPMVPYYNLSRLHREIKQDCPEPVNGIIAAFKEIIPALKLQKKNPDYYIQKNIPDTARPAAAEQIWFGNEADVRNGWIKVCLLDVFPENSIRRFDYLEKSFAIYRMERDVFHATDGFCNHGNSHLSEGMIVDEMVECAKHNGRFCLKNGDPCRNPVKKAIGIYPLKIMSGMLLMKLVP